jgi:hypothetical protein
MHVGKISEVNRKMRTYDGSPNNNEGTRRSMGTPNVPALQGLARFGANSFSL